MSHCLERASIFSTPGVVTLVRGMSSSYADPLSAPLPHLSSARRRFSAVRAAPRPGEKTEPHTLAGKRHRSENAGALNN